MCVHLCSSPARPPSPACPPFASQRLDALYHQPRRTGTNTADPHCLVRAVSAGRYHNKDLITPTLDALASLRPPPPRTPGLLAPSPPPRRLACCALSASGIPALLACCRLPARLACRRSPPPCTPCVLPLSCISCSMVCLRRSVSLCLEHCARASVAAHASSSSRSHSSAAVNCTCLSVPLGCPCPPCLVPVLLPPLPPCFLSPPSPVPRPLLHSSHRSLLVGG